MKARLIRETKYAQPGGNLTDDRGFEMEDLEQVIQNTEGKTLYPRDLANFVDFFIEMGDQNAADKLMNSRLFSYIHTLLKKFRKEKVHIEIK